MSNASNTKPSGRGRPPIDRSAQLEELRVLGVFDLTAARLCGLTAAAVERLVAAGTLIRVGENLFIHAQAEIDPEVIEFAVACRRLGPEAAIGGLSALRYYGLTDSGSIESLWLVVPPGRKTRRPLYRLIRTTTPLNLEVIVEPPGYRIVTLERAIVEALRYASKLGLETGLAAAKIAFCDGRTSAGELLRVARSLGLESHVLRHWEALLTLEGPKT